MIPRRLFGRSGRHDSGLNRTLKGLVDSAEGKFEVGTGFLPKPEGAGEGGVIVGGASLWMMNSRPEAEQKPHGSSLNSNLSIGTGLLAYQYRVLPDYHEGV